MKGFPVSTGTLDCFRVSLSRPSMHRRPGVQISAYHAYTGLRMVMVSEMAVDKTKGYWNIKFCHQY